MLLVIRWIVREFMVLYATGISRCTAELAFKFHVISKGEGSCCCSTLS